MYLKWDLYDSRRPDVVIPFRATESLMDYLNRHVDELNQNTLHPNITLCATVYGFKCNELEINAIGAYGIRLTTDEEASVLGCSIKRVPLVRTQLNRKVI